MTRAPSPLVVLLAGAIAAGLAGCTAIEPTDAGADPTPARAMASPTPAADASSTEPAELPTGVIGRAALLDVDGAAVGTIEVWRSGDELLEVRSDLVYGMDLDRSELVLAPRPIADDETCFDSGLRVALGAPSDDEPGRWGVADLGSGDPSFLDEAVLVRGPLEFTGEVECLAEIVAHGPIEWTFPPLRSGLVAVDGGATGGARGEAVVEDGAPVAYAVAAGDLIDEVAARFGLTADDVLYLNPARTPPSGMRTLHPGEVLNLVVERR